MPKKTKRPTPRAKHEARRRAKRREHSGNRLHTTKARSTKQRYRARTKLGSNRIKLMPARQVAVRAQETAFQLVVAIDRGGVIHRFLRRYANERKRPGRISDPGRYRELIETIRREAFLVLALQVDTNAPQRLGVRLGGSMSAAQSELMNLFREEFYVALGRSLEFSDEDFNDFCRDLDVYRKLLDARHGSQRRSSSIPAPTGPFVDRCGFLLDSPMLDQGRQAAARFESELHAMASSVIRKVFCRRPRV